MMGKEAMQDNKETAVIDCNNQGHVGGGQNYGALFGTPNNHGQIRIGIPPLTDHTC